MSKSSKSLPVAEICFYGTRTVGAGWLARVNPAAVAVPEWSNGLIGTGEPQAGRTFTDALFQAVEHLNAVGLTSGLVTVFDPSGSHMATLDLARTIPCFGDLWVSRPSAGVTLYVLPADEIAAAAR